MKRDLVFGRVIPAFWDSLQTHPESTNTCIRESRYDRVYTSFFGILTPEQKLRYIQRFEEPGHRIDRALAGVWKIGAAFQLSDAEVFARLTSPQQNTITRLFWINRRNEFFRSQERAKKTLHHIIPKSRGGDRRYRNHMEEELHTMLHQIFGIMLADEKQELLRWYERPYQELIGDERIPFRYTPIERLLLKNVRAGMMRYVFSDRLADENERRAQAAADAA